MSLYTLNPAEPTDPGWRQYNTRTEFGGNGGVRYIGGARMAAVRRAQRLGISVTVEKDGKPWRLVHPGGKSERLDLGPGRGAFRGKPGHRRAVTFNDTPNS